MMTLVIFDAALEYKKSAERVGHKLAKLAEVEMSRRVFQSSSACSSLASWGCSSVGYIPRDCGIQAEYNVRITEPISSVSVKDQLKAEAKANELMKDTIGLEQWKVYRETHLVAVKAKWIWLIGDFYKRYDKERPFNDKPDVIRIDQNAQSIWRRLFSIGANATSFCVQTVGSNYNYPYTDKVIAFMVQCAHEEDKFYRMANRIDELYIDKFPRCAMYEGN